MTRVYLVDDHQIMREGLRALLEVASSAKVSTAARENNMRLPPF